jgi:hypothetical protein
VFAICARWKPAKVNAEPAHLSAADVLAFAPLVARVASETKATERRVGAFVLAILPWFKGAQKAGKLDEQGRPKVRLHWTQLRKAAGDESDYAKIRDAFGTFEELTTYLPATQATRPADAHARTYALTVPLSTHPKGVWDRPGVRASREPSGFWVVKSLHFQSDRPGKPPA